MNTPPIRYPAHIGMHIVAELFNCRGDVNSEPLIRKTLTRAAKASGATLISVNTHIFKPVGVTAIALLRESHISVHTWPEYNFMALDVFTCTKQMNPRAGLRIFTRMFKPQHTEVSIMKRGKRRAPAFVLKGQWHTDAVVSEVEYLAHPGIQGVVKIKKCLAHLKSPFQDIRVVESADMGKALILDGILQTTERDEFIYHEMLVHPALLPLQRRSRVLVVGGGDGGSLREALKYPSVNEAYLVEIDAEVVGACKRFLPSLNRGAFHNKRARVVFEDGAKFVRRYANTFDAVIVDSSDPLGPARVLFSNNFYAAISKALTPHGVLSLQAGTSYPWETSFLRNLIQRLRGIFPHVEVRQAYIPSYFGVMNFVVARKKQQGAPDLSRRFKTVPLRTRYYTPELHRCAAVLPKHLQDQLAIR